MDGWVLPHGAIHPWKISWQWTNNHLKMYRLLKMVIFHCHVSFQGCKHGKRVSSKWATSWQSHPVWAQTGVLERVLLEKSTLHNDNQHDIKWWCSSSEYFLLLLVFHGFTKRYLSFNSIRTVASKDHGNLEHPRWTIGFLSVVKLSHWFIGSMIGINHGPWLVNTLVDSRFNDACSQSLCRQMQQL